MVGIQLLFSQHSPDSRMSDTLLVLIPGVPFTTSRISSSTSGIVHLGHPLLATQGAKFPCSQRQRWILTDVFLSGHLNHGYFPWYKWRATTPLPSAKLYMKCKLASSWFEYIVTTIWNHHTLNTQYLVLYTSPIKIWKLSKIVPDWLP
jgi:hypothetical protein